MAALNMQTGHHSLLSNRVVSQVGQTRRFIG
jgi:hypothetical protein